MEFEALWSLFNSGIIADFKKKTLTVKIGKLLIIKDISIATVKRLTADSARVESLLSNHFITRRVMWEDFRKEEVEFCIASLNDLKSKNFEQADLFGKSKAKDDKFLSSWIRCWGNECDKAIKEFQDATQNEKISRSIDSEYVLRAHEKIPKILGEFRRKTYPVIQVLIALLDEENPIRKAAESKLSSGKNLLVRYYDISVNKLLDPDWQITDPKGRDRNLVWRVFRWLCTGGGNTRREV